jgi:acetyl esterase/lipase
MCLGPCDRVSVIGAGRELARGVRTRLDRGVNPMKYPAIALLAILPLALPAVFAAESKAKGKAAAKAAEPAAYAASVPKPTFAGVRYGTHERQVLDFWKAESAAPAPLVFVIHGGGWQGGEKERVDRFVDVAALLKAGISVAAINYRLIRHAEADGVVPPG